MQLERLNEQDFEEVWSIMEQSFPSDERRTKEGQRSLLSHPAYRLYGCRRDGALFVFLALWEFEEFVFGEHFAVQPGLRGGGIGGVLLKQLMEQITKPIVFEVELPEGEIERRRIAFYERNGFVLNDYDYVQPAMGEGKNNIPLRIMSRSKALSAEQFIKVRSVLYREVYGLSDGTIPII